MNKKYYYDIEDDLKNYPYAWCYLVIGGRNTGKTYSALKYCYNNNKKFVFVKRTNDDVDLLCSGNGRIGQKENEFGVDLSPFKSINRDIKSNVKAYSIKKGLGGFWKCENGEPNGEPIGYLISLNAVSKFKGFDLSECSFLIFDEFIPNIYDRNQHTEGNALLDLYKTIARDREHRGEEPLKMLCLANATKVSNPTFNILEVTNEVADMQNKNQEYKYDEERGILIHQIENNEEFDKKERETAIYKALGNTAWGEMAFGNCFAYDDFSNVGRVSLKGYIPVCVFCYKNSTYYVYQKDGHYFVTDSRHNSEKIYNLNKENDQKLFMINERVDIRDACIEGKALFSNYTAYDIIMNYTKYFKM